MKSQLKQLGRLGARGLTALSPVRSVLRHASARSWLPEAVWMRLPVNARFDVQVPGGGRFAYVGVHDDMFARFLHWRGLDEWEKETFPVWLKLARQSTMVLDIGAHAGSFSLVACAASPQVQVIAFEPLPRNYDRLRTNIGANGWGRRIDARNIALGAEPGEAEMFVPDTAFPGSSTLAQEGFGREPGSRLKVVVDTVDRVVPPDAMVGLAKIDVEGFEPFVLQGMRATLERCRTALVMEVNPDGPAAELEAILAPLGYRFFHLEAAGPSPREHIVPDATGAERNYLCLHREDHRLGL